MASKTSSIIYSSIVSMVIVCTVTCSSLNAQSRRTKPKAFLVELSDTISDYQQVFSGHPQTASMRSGLVVLLPSKSVGIHSTENYEEAVVVLSGSGEMRITGGETLYLKPNSVAYCPPHTEHDVVNTSSQPLRYLYIVAKRRH